MTKPVAAAEFAPPAPSLFSDSGTLAQSLVEAYLAVRGETERRAAPLSPEDQLIQSMPDASSASTARVTSPSTLITRFYSIPIMSAPVRGTPVTSAAT